MTDDAAATESGPQDADTGLPSRAVVIYESMTGNTKRAAEMIAHELDRAGIDTTVCSTKLIDLPALSAAELVIVGSWVDGLFFFGQKPGGVRRLAALPVIDGKRSVVFCTYALDTGKTLEKLAGIVARRGGDVIGGYPIRRDRLAESVIDFVDRLLGVLESGETSGRLELSGATT